MAKKKSNSAIRTEKDKKVPKINRAIYTAVDPTYGYPEGMAVAAAALRSAASLFNPDKMGYEVTDSVADAAWRKRLGLSYDDKFLIENENGTYRLPKELEMEIPTDTTRLKRRIANNEKLVNSSGIMGDDWRLVKGMLDLDKETLESLRKTYKTGEPVVISEYSNNSRKLAEDGQIIEGAGRYKSPLNVLQNYTIQYDPSSNSMLYRDVYDFNDFESVVPGEPFNIEGSIPLKAYGGYKYSWGGDLLKSLDLKNVFSGSAVGNALKGATGGIGQAIGGIAGGAISGGLESGAGKAITGITGTLGGALSKVNPILGGAVSAVGGIVGGVTNKLFGSKLNQENIAAIEGDISKANAFTSNAGDFDSLAGNFASAASVQGFNRATVGKDGTFSNKAKRKYLALKQQAEDAEAWVANSLVNNAENIALTNQQLLEANYNAYGGTINRFDNGGNTESIYDTILKGKNKYRSLTGKPNEFLDTWNQARLNTGRFDSQLGEGLMEAQKESRDSAPVFSSPNTYSKVSAIRGVPLFILGNETPEEAADRFKDEVIYQAKKIHNRVISNEKEQGEYNKDSHTIFYDSNGQNPMSTLLHEQAHASKAKPQESVIKDIILKNNEYNDIYKDNESEIYSRLMQVREANQIDPNKVWDEESLREFKKNAIDFNFLNRYSDNTILDIFNNVATNDLPKDNGLSTDLSFESNLAAYGGPIDMKYTGVMSPFGNQFKDGGIFIKPSKRGTFTAAAKKRGMGVQEFASKVVANKEDYSPAMVKKANFAKNTSKWKHADGGNLFTNGVTIIGNGGTHEQSPLEGVPMGVDNQGIPNLVEEGEVIFNDYVFSNRLRVPKEVRQKYKLRGVTFADAAKQAQKESEERPNDPIAKDTMNAIMSELMQEQEMIRAKRNKNRYAYGGRLANKFADAGPIDTIDTPYSIYTLNPTDDFDYNNWFNVDKNNLGKVTKYSDAYKNFYFTADQARAYAANNPNDESLKSYLAKGNKLEDLTDEDVQKGSLDGMHGWLHKARAKAAASEKITDESQLPTKEEVLKTIESILPPEDEPLLNRNNTKIKSIPIELEEENIEEESLPKGIKPMKDNWMRYAPLFGAGLSVLNDWFGGNEPDYSNANMYQRAIEGSNREVRTRPIGNYLSYNPFDTELPLIQSAANAAASRRAITNNAGGNRAAAMAGILASDYNTGLSIGELARNAREYNLAQREKVEAFNRGTNQYNSEMGTKVDMFNAENASRIPGLYANLASMRQGIYDRNRAEKAANLTNFLQGIGDLGREKTDRDMLRWLSDLGVLTYSPDGKFKSSKKSKGGKLNRKKRGGFTI